MVIEHIVPLVGKKIAVNTAVGQITFFAGTLREVNTDTLTVDLIPSTKMPFKTIVVPLTNIANIGEYA